MSEIQVAHVENEIEVRAANIVSTRIATRRFFCRILKTSLHSAGPCGRESI